MKSPETGFSKAELSESPYARFYNPTLPPLQEQVVEALLTGPVAHELMYPVERSSSMLDDELWPVENGYTVSPLGAIRVACLTKMPKVAPHMWDWWFHWHGNESQRYRLWHPKSHCSAHWQDGRNDLTHYVGRTSLITEFMGSKKAYGAISFVPPSTLGLNEKTLADRGEVAVCARISLPKTPINAGWLLHHIRPVKGGSEMRSRVWLGGENVQLGYRKGPIFKAINLIMGQFSRLMTPMPSDLLVHNAQEMSHLASFLPELYKEFHVSTDKDSQSTNQAPIKAVEGAVV